MSNPPPEAKSAMGGKPRMKRAIVATAGPTIQRGMLMLPLLPDAAAILARACTDVRQRYRTDKRSELRTDKHLDRTDNRQ